MYKTTCHAKPYLYRSVHYRYSALYVCNLFLWLTWWWVLLYRTLRKVTSTNMRENSYVVTPRSAAAAAAVVSAVVPRRPTKEYTHPYSMMHCRLPTAGIEVAPHYHQLLVSGAALQVLLDPNRHNEVSGHTGNVINSR